MAVRPPLLQSRALTKVYGGTTALDRVDLTIHVGEVHALMGENGAGKSTLGKVMAGAVPATSGRFLIDGKPTRIASPTDAQALGITIIFQELDLFPHLTVAENIAIRNLAIDEGVRARYGSLDAFAKPVLRRVGLDVSPRTAVGSLSVAQQQLVAIARALSMDARLIVFDESTSALTDDAVDRLFDVIRQLRDDGVACVLVTHKMDEVFRVADRITVLRDGRYVGTREARDTGMSELVRMMVGHDVPTDQSRDTASTREVLLRLNDVSTDNLRRVRLTVRRGEVVGLAGLVGAGRGAVGRTIFGLEPLRSGRIEVGGKPVTVGSPRDAMRQGLAYVPRDRKVEGLMMQMSVRENVSMASLSRLSRIGWVRRGREKRRATDVSRQTRIKAASPHTPIESLSGGNQQKALLGRWLLTNAQLYFLDDPTRGVDIGAKEDIYDIIDELARAGRGVLMVSSELPELLRCCDRVLVMNQGRVVADLARDEATQAKILAYATSAEAAAA